jgi:hypothetical protein
MTDKTKTKALVPSPTVERIEEFTPAELNDLCDSTFAGIEAGGGFGWVTKPPRDVLERYWQGVTAMPSRILFVARLDGVICGSCQLVKPPIEQRGAEIRGASDDAFHRAVGARAWIFQKCWWRRRKQTAVEEGSVGDQFRRARNDGSCDRAV